MRFSGFGAGAAVFWVAVGLLWMLGGGSGLVLGWFVVVGVVGAFVPGAANQVTLARVYLAAPALFFALRGEFAAVAVVVAVAGLSDLVDGTVARRFGSPTSFGGGFDPVVDGLFAGALCIGLAVGGTIPFWLALVIIARYLLPALGGGLLIFMGRRPELRHTLMGQVSTVLILVLVGGVCLLRGLHQDAGALLTGAEVVIPVATLATFVHLAWASRRTVASPEPG